MTGDSDDLVVDDDFLFVIREGTLMTTASVASLVVCSSVFYDTQLFVSHKLVANRTLFLRCDHYSSVTDKLLEFAAEALD